ncbi:MAG: hypothetical protein U0401_05880 [Anaerolineae bacterium]
MAKRINDIFGQPLTVINIGRELGPIGADRAPVINVDSGLPKMVSALARDQNRVDIDAANEEVCLNRIKQALARLGGHGDCPASAPGMPGA